ncbi:MAG: hypothetical protein M1549_00445 [Candidatus Dependentiae bacterium]|nr:hypothetical protein [Candidatus Dependentiae bacterium]
MSQRPIIVCIVIITASFMHAAEYKFAPKKLLKNEKDEKTSLVKPASLYSVLMSLNAVTTAQEWTLKNKDQNKEKEKLSKTEKEDLMAEELWSLASAYFSTSQSLEPDNDLAAVQTMIATIELLTTFHTQLKAKKKDLGPLHQALEDLSPQRKLAVLSFTNYVLGPDRFLNILAHSLKQDILSDGELYNKLEPAIAGCPYALTQTIWKKVGVYGGNKTPHAKLLFPKTGVMHIPLQNGIRFVDLSNGTQTKNLEKAAEKQKEKLEEKPEKKINEDDFLAALGWDENEQYERTIKRGKQKIRIYPYTYEFWDQREYQVSITGNDKFYLKKPSKQLCLTDKFLAGIQWRPIL